MSGEILSEQNQEAGRCQRPGFLSCIKKRSFRQNEDGVAAVEFALVSVPFLGLLFAIFETALIFFTVQGVEAATAEAARMVMTGQAQGNAAVTTADQFKTNYICTPAAPMVRILPSYVNCSSLVVDVRTATSFATAPLNNSFITEATHKYCAGNNNDVVVLRVAYPMPVFASVLSMNSMHIGDTYQNRTGQTYFGGGWKHIIVATSVFRNEPFPGVAPLPTC